MQRLERKSFPSNKEFVESHSHWLREVGWSDDYHWNREAHASCKHTPSGMWMLKGFGCYETAPGEWRLYTSHRCSKCGIIVMHSQPVTAALKPLAPVGRSIYLP